MTNTPDTAESIAERIVNKGAWHETRATYAPTYIEYGKLRALIATAIKDAEARAYERAARLAEDLSTERLENPHEIWLHGFNVAQTAIGKAIRARAKADQEGK